jgi:hypothetical protein
MATPPPRIDKYESRRIRCAIRDVLLDVWDPIGVKDWPDARDEYDAYLGDVFELLVGGAPDSKIAAYLYWVAHERMGFSPASASQTEPTVRALRQIQVEKS